MAMWPGTPIPGKFRRFVSLPQSNGKLANPPEYCDSMGVLLPSFDLPPPRSRGHVQPANLAAAIPCGPDEPPFRRRKLKGTCAR